MMAAITSYLLTEPETQCLLIRERERPLWNADNPFKRLGVGRDGALHDLKSDGAGVARDKKVRGLLLKAQHERDEDFRCLVWRIDVQRSFVEALLKHGGEERDHDALAQAS